MLKRPNKKGALVNARLIEARKDKGISAKLAAQEVGVSAQVLSLYELGKCDPSEDVFRKLINLYDMPFEFYFKEIVESNIEGPVFYRKFSKATKTERDRAQTEANWFVHEIVDQLSERIKFPEVDKLFMKIKQSVDIEEGDFDPDLMAQIIRREWNLLNKPIENLMIELEKRGVFIAKLNLHKDIDGFSFWEKGRPFIFVNRNNNYFRLRMSVAHELCHLFFHGAEDVEKDIKRIEEEAKAFAGAFLLPNPGFTEDIKYINLQNLLYLKPKWRVSLQGLLARCKQLELIDEGRDISLNKQISIKGWRKIEPFDKDIPPEKPILLKQAIEMLINKNVYTKSEMLSLFALNENFVEDACSLEKNYFYEKPAVIVNLFPV